MSGLTEMEQIRLRIAVDRDETAPGDYNDTRYLFAAVARIVDARLIKREGEIRASLGLRP